MVGGSIFDYNRGSKDDYNQQKKITGRIPSIFRKWSKDLMDDAELVAIQLPGREERFNEPLLSNVSQVVDNLCQNFNNYLDKPFIFFGHSIGALIAFEFVRALRRKRMPKPEHLIISGTKAPQTPLKRTHVHIHTNNTC
jgi:medium-chain acyl-[acyl-carrier-protein] hydrolase